MPAEEKLGALMIEIGIQAGGFQTQMSEISRRMGMAKAEFMAAGGSVKGFADTTEGAKAKAAMLTEQISLLKGKVALLDAEYRQAAAGGTETARAAQELKMKLDGTAGELAKLEAELKQADNGMASFSKRMADSAKSLKELGGKLSDAGKTLTMGLTVPILGAAAAIGALVNKSLETADALQQMSDVTGLSTERLQELKYIGAQVDVELDTITGSQRFLTKAMEAAGNGTKAQAGVFKELGIAVKDGSGHLRDSNEVFGEAIDALGRMTNPTERDATALKLFGKSALELNPLIKAGSVEIARLTKEAHDNGAVMSGKSVQALDAFGDSLEAMKLSISTAVMQMGASMLPTLQNLANIFREKVLPAIRGVVEFVAKLIDGFTKLPGWVQTVIGIFAGLAVGIGPVLTGLGSLISAIGAIKAALPALAAASGPIGIAVGAIAALTLGIVALASKTDAAVEVAKAHVKAIDDQMVKTDIEARAARGLADELYALADKENKSNSEKARMKALVSQLNTLMPDLGLAINEVTGQLNKQSQATRETIDQVSKRIKLAAIEQSMLETQLKLMAAQERLAAANKRYADNVKLDHDKVRAWVAFGKEIVAASDEVTIYQDKLDGLTTAYDGLAGSVVAANNDIGKSQQQTFARSQEEIDQMADEYKKAYDKLKQDIKDYYAAVEQETDRHISQMGSYEDKGIQKSKLTAEQMRANLARQVRDFNDWRNGIRSLAAKVPDDVLLELQRMGPAYDTVIDDLNKMAKNDPKGLNAFIATVRAKMGAATDAAKDELSKMPGAAYDTGKNVAQGFADGLNIKNAEIVTAAKKMGLTVNKYLDKHFDFGSPSKLMKKLGGYVGAGFAIGMESMASRVAGAAATMNRAATESFTLSSLGVPALAFAGAGGGGSSVVNNNYNLSATVPMTYNGQPSGALSESTKRALFRELLGFIPEENRRTGR